MKRKKVWVYSPKKVWPTVPKDVQELVVNQTESVITRLIFNYFAEHDRRSNQSLSTITSRWRRSYFYIVAVYHDNSQGEDSPNYEERLARLEYVSPDNYNLSYVRYTGEWIEIALDQTLAECLAEIAQNELFHPR